MDRHSNRIKQLSTVLLVIAAGSLASCGLSNWRSSYLAGMQKLEEKGPDRLGKAETYFKAAVDDAERNRVPERQYADAIAALGKTLFEEGKYSQATYFLIEAVGLATATNMPVDQNESLLTMLSQSYEKLGNYPQALQTQSVLVTLLESAKSPDAADYKTAKVALDRLKKLQPAETKQVDECCKKDALVPVDDKQDVPIDGKQDAPLH